jgi:hypothetical protein
MLRSWYNTIKAALEHFAQIVSGSLVLTMHLQSFRPPNIGAKRVI